MSKRKIKNKFKKKKGTIIPEISLKQIAQMNLFNLRGEKRQKDAEELGDFIADGKLDPYRLKEHSYLSFAAREINWSTNRLKETIELINLDKLIEKEKQDETK